MRNCDLARNSLYNGAVNLNLPVSCISEAYDSSFVLRSECGLDVATGADRLGL